MILSNTAGAVSRAHSTNRSAANIHRAIRENVIFRKHRIQAQPRLQRRVEALRKIDRVGPVTALSWALEVGDPARFVSVKRAVSYCGLASALRESAGRQKARAVVQAT
jgi:transposase